VYGADADALVWYTVWDDSPARDRFARALARIWAMRRAGDSGRRYRIESLTIDDHPGARLVDAPVDWVGWARIPEVRVVE
jgi:hypothetical protein